MKLAKWFMNRLQKIAQHNGHDSVFTSEKGNSLGLWTQCDLIAREYLNNGGGSAKGFLGITRAECIKCYDYMCANRETLIELDYVSRKAWNNYGIILWDNYQF